VNYVHKCRVLLALKKVVHTVTTGFIKSEDETWIINRGHKIHWIRVVTKKCTSVSSGTAPTWVTVTTQHCSSTLKAHSWTQDTSTLHLRVRYWLYTIHMEYSQK